MPAEVPLPSLTPDAIEALGAVDLHVAYGYHGYRAKLPEHGFATLGVNDHEYQQIENRVTALKPERGDVLATEANGFEPWSLEDFTTYHTKLDAHTPYLHSADFTGLEQLDPDALKRYYRLARDLQIIAPFHYGEGLAVSRGITIEHADISAEATKSIIGLASADNESVGIRDAHMATALGDIASRMVTDGEKPRLQYMVGGAHRSGIERILSAAGVEWTASSFSPKRPIRDAMTKILIRADEAGIDLRRTEAWLHRGAVKSWERNLHAKLADQKSTLNSSITR